jgi:hypothetical protein
MLASGMTDIHYLALDVNEAIELQVLQSLPWYRVYIGVKLAIQFTFNNV